MNLEDLLHEQAEGADLRASSLDQITKRAGRIRRRRAAAGIAGVAAAVVIVAGGIFAVNVGSHPSSVGPASNGPSPDRSPSTATTTATEVDSGGAPSTTLLSPGHDVDHTTNAEPEVPYLWNGTLNLPAGAPIQPSDTTGLLKNAEILTYAAAPDQHGAYYALANLGQGEDPEITMFGGGDGFEPLPSTPGGLVATADGSKVAVAMRETASNAAWTVRLHTTASDTVTWTLPDGMEPTTLAGILADGTVVIDASGSTGASESPIYLARPDGSLQKLDLTGAPQDANTYRAASVSSTGDDVAVTFTTEGTRSCWGIASATTGALKAYRCDSGSYPTFSPDGSEIVTVGNTDAATPGRFSVATIYDAATLDPVTTYSTVAAQGARTEFFGPTLVWDHGSVLATVFDSENDRSTQGWTLVWLHPGGRPDYQYVRALLVPGDETDPPPFVFAADALRVAAQ